MIVTFGRIQEPSTRKLILEMVQKLAASDAATSVDDAEEQDVECAGPVTRLANGIPVEPVAASAQVMPFSKRDKS